MGRRLATLTSALALTGAVALGGLGGAPAGQAASAAATPCQPVSNIEAIIDDSGSMEFTDPNRLRVQALDLLIETPGNEGITLGAVEFGGVFFGEGTAADTVFGPEPIGPNRSAMIAALNEKIKADNGGTDYNAAFAKAKEADPEAKAWIFLTDGGHDVGEYMNGHRGGPPTYVIGFGSAITGSDGERLAQIASDTGGKYFPETDSSNLQAVVNEIGTILTCQTPARTFKDVFAKAGQQKRHAVRITGVLHTAQLTLSWASPLDSFTISNVRVVRKGRTVAVAARRKHHGRKHHRRKHRLKVTERTGSTFLVVKLSSLVKGTLRFNVRATKLGSGTTGGVKLTTQLTQRR